jgi:adenylate cyclase
MKRGRMSGSKRIGELVNPKIKEHRGRIVKNTGDGLLAEFPSVVDAVRCAVEIQRGMAERNAEAPPERRVEFRVGINLGDVIAEGEDIFGDGVNVAARLEALAEPGGICVSRVVRDQVRDRVNYTFEDLGEQLVKNIARPVRIYRVCDASTGTVPPEEAEVVNIMSPSLKAPRLSIVVLPFVNLSNDPDQQYFADGITICRGLGTCLHTGLGTGTPDGGRSLVKMTRARLDRYPAGRLSLQCRAR